LDKLLDFLASIGFEPTEGEFKSVIFEDAIINIYVDENGKQRIDISPLDRLSLATDESIDDYFEMDFDEEEFLVDDEEEFGNVFDIGELVTVKGYEGRAFEVGGYAHSLSYENGRQLEEVTYSLVDIQSKEVIEAYEEDMKFYTSNQQPKQDSKPLPKVGGELPSLVDKLLDKYNDYKLLYEQFGDEEYKQEMDRLLGELSKTKL
jgi:hypothetical protein